MELEIVFKDGRRETFDNVVSFNVTTPEVVQTPTEGKLFEVNPLEIDRSRFEKPMKDQRQEWTRQIILKAFDEVDKNPKKYASPFYTLIPELKCSFSKTVEQLKNYAISLGGQMANWVQQALEWGQRISNGESWERICNKFDSADWYRMIIWKNGYARLVGGAKRLYDYRPASDVDTCNYRSSDKVLNIVPLVVLKKK